MWLLGTLTGIGSLHRQSRDSVLFFWLRLYLRHTFGFRMCWGFSTFNLGTAQAYWANRWLCFFSCDCECVDEDSFFWAITYSGDQRWAHECWRRARGCNISLTQALALARAFCLCALYLQHHLLELLHYCSCIRRCYCIILSDVWLLASHEFVLDLSLSHNGCGWVQDRQLL